MFSLDIKDRLIQVGENTLENRIRELDGELRILKSQYEGETKSSAGDKYETGRAMLHLELEKKSAQYDKTVQLYRAFSEVRKLPKSSDVVKRGSLVITSGGNFYISVGLGTVKVDDTLFYFVSPQAPVAAFLLDKKAGDEVQFNNQTLIIKRII